jgi:peptide/nickel transport system permease protein
MVAFLFRRVLSGLFLLALLVLLTFTVFNAIPTNPACLVVPCGPHTTTNDVQIQAADHRLGIDRPILVQYGKYVWRLVRFGDFGKAWIGDVSVRTEIGQALPVTASLIAGGMLLTLMLALPFACAAALRPRSPTDRGLLAFSVIGIAIHPFVLGIAIRDFFGAHFGVRDFSYCPLTGQTELTTCGGPADWASHMAVPWIVFALLFLPLYMRMLRVRLLETFDEPWISTARAKGATERRVVLGHALRNAVGPVLPLIAIDAGTAITAAIYLETVFGLQGLGGLAVRALAGEAGGFDLPLIVGIVIVVGGFVVLLNAAADVAAAWLDPRTRTRATSGLIPLPAAVAAHPRARIALNAGLAIVVIAVVAFAATRNDSSAQAGADIGDRVGVVRPSLRDAYDLDRTGSTLVHATLRSVVDRVEFGTRGWRVHATLTNASSVPIPIQAPAPSTVPGAPTINLYPHQGMSLLVSTPTGYGSNDLHVFPANEFSPVLPRVLRPHRSWRGTFTGREPLGRRAVFYVGFGQFLWRTRLVSVTTNGTGKAP